MKLKTLPVLFIISSTLVIRTDGQFWKTNRNIRGVSYAPTPRGLNPDFTDILLAKDMFNTDFTAMWGVDGRDGVVSRNDLQVLRDQGINSLHLYGWDARSDVRDHRSFLDYCQQLGIGVWVPISDAFLDFGNHEAIARGVVDTTRIESGEIHPAVYGWLISNEYDLGGIPIGNVVAVINIVADADPGNDRPFSCPVSTQVNYNGDSRPSMGALIELHDNLPPEIFNDRFIHSVNPFFPFDAIEEQLFAPYKQQFEEVWGMAPIPLMIGESGRSSDEVGVDEMTNEFTGMACGFLGLMENENPYNFVGFFFFEFTEEDWKGKPDQFYGLHSLGDNISPVLPTAVKHAPGATFEVNGLTPLPAWNNIVSILATGPKSNGLCNGRTGGASTELKTEISLLIAAIAFMTALTLVTCCAVKWHSRNARRNMETDKSIEMNQSFYAHLPDDGDEVMDEESENIRV